MGHAWDRDREEVGQRWGREVGLAQMRQGWGKDASEVAQIWGTLKRRTGKDDGNDTLPSWSTAVVNDGPR